VAACFSGSSCDIASLHALEQHFFDGKCPLEHAFAYWDNFSYSGKHFFPSDQFGVYPSLHFAVAHQT
jgi:hypothetical protein